jgi:hypothetical protein
MTRRRTTAVLRPFIELLEGRWVPTTLTPTTFLDGSLGSGSLRDAVLQLNADSGTDDDIIQLEAGTYTLTIPNVGGRHETAGLTGDLNLTQTSHRWIVQGAGPSTIIDASQLQDRVYQVVNPGIQVIFQDLVIQGGLAQDNGADGTLAGTTDALGGGILNNGGDLTLDDVVVQNNLARGGDGAVFSPPGHNSFGGGIYSTGGALSMAGATLANNQARGGRGADDYGPGAGEGGSGGGGGLYTTGGSLDLANSNIANNQATGGDGGSGGSAPGNGGNGTGGGIYATGGLLNISNTTISANGVRGGHAGRPGASCTGHCGAADGLAQGGGIYASGGLLTLTNTTISANNGAEGGGIYNHQGTLTVSNSTLSGNSATQNGGGVYNYQGTLTVSNSTLSGNSATGSFGEGGGIYNGFQGTLTLSNSTLSDNRTDLRDSFRAGGGLNVSTVSSSVLHNTLIAGNVNIATVTTSDDVSGRLDPGGDYNLIGDGTGMTGLSNGVHGNQVGNAFDLIDPLLGPLQDNGGPTFTMALLPGSPAIDAGNNAYATDWDQRGPGYPRIVNGVIDIGAFEVQAHALGRPTELPLPDPVPVQALGMVGNPLLGQPPGLPADPSPLPRPGIPDGQTGQPEPVPTGGSQEDPPLSLAVPPPTPGQPADSLGLLGLWDEMAGWS